MSYFTTDLYETKRELIIFSEKLAQGLSKSKKKFLMNMLYGIAKNQSCLLSQIARALDEDVKLINIEIYSRYTGYQFRQFRNS